MAGRKRYRLRRCATPHHLIAPHRWAAWLQTALDEAWTVPELAQAMEMPAGVIRERAVKYGVPLLEDSGLSKRVWLQTRGAA